MVDLDKFILFMKENNIPFKLVEYGEKNHVVMYQLQTKKGFFNFDEHDNFLSIFL